MTYSLSLFMFTSKIIPYNRLLAYVWICCFCFQDMLLLSFNQLHLLLSLNFDKVQESVDKMAELYIFPVKSFRLASIKSIEFNNYNNNLFVTHLKQQSIKQTHRKKKLLITY